MPKKITQLRQPRHLGKPHSQAAGKSVPNIISTFFRASRRGQHLHIQSSRPQSLHHLPTPDLIPPTNLRRKQIADDAYLHSISFGLPLSFFCLFQLSEISAPLSAQGLSFAFLLLSSSTIRNQCLVLGRWPFSAFLHRYQHTVHFLAPLNFRQVNDWKNGQPILRIMGWLASY